MRINIDNFVRITLLQDQEIKEIKTDLTLLNPKWLENNKMGYWNGKTPMYIKGYKQRGQTLVVPRGYFSSLRLNPTCQVVDNRRILSPIALNFAGILRPYQQDAADALLARDEGVLSAPTGSGKTCIALYVIAQRHQPTLIMVHTKDLLEQWIDRIGKFLEIPKKGIGIIGGGKCTIKDINVGMVQTIYKKGKHFKDKIGFVIVDECHWVPARTFSEAVTQFDAKYLLGLSATPWRRDRLTDLIHWYLGPLAYKISQKGMIESGNVLPIKVIKRYTDFDTDLDASLNYSKVMRQLRADAKRNNMIADDISTETKRRGGIIIALSDNREHCSTIKDLLRTRGVASTVITGQLSITTRGKILEQVEAKKIRVLMATGQLLGEGFDCPGLTIMFLMTPIKFHGRLLQYLGRIRRPAPGKKEAIVYDYIDRRVGVLYASSLSRRKVYNDLA